MMTPEFITFHGSPGTPYDFEPLKRAIVQGNWHGFIRYTEVPPELKEDETKLRFAVGYSFGAISALEYAANNKVDGIILISPYFPNEGSGLLKKVITALPLLGEKILSSKADAIIEEFLIKSSHPVVPPNYYKEYAKYLKNPKLLKAAVWEKKASKPRIEKILSKLHDQLCLVIYGEEDQTSTYEDHVFPLKRVFNQSFKEKLLKNAGHALAYTHPIDTAKVIGEFVKELALKKGLSQKVEDLQLTEEKKHNYINPETPFGYHEGEHELNNVAAFLYHHLNINKDQEILTWVHPKRLEYWDKDSQDTLAHDSITVKELDLLVGKIAAGLKKLGLKKDDKVIIFIPMSLYLYSAMFAVQKLGAVAVFLDSWARRDQMGVAVDVVKPRAIISVERAFDYLSEVKEIQDIPIKIVAGPHDKEYSERLEKLMITNDYQAAVPVNSEHTALITFTTGSSGVPKGADRSHRFLAAQHYALNRHLPYEKGDADLPAFPIFSLNNLAAGVKTVIPAFDVGSPSVDDAKILLAQFRETKTTATTLSPSLLRTLYNYCLEKEIKLPELKRIVTGGAPVSEDDVEAMKRVAPNAEVLVLYGSTEVEPMAHIEAKEMLEQAEENRKDPLFVPNGVNVGKFDSGLKVKYIKIVKEPIKIDSDEQWSKYVVNSKEVGEIIVSGEHVCEKYYNNEEATENTKIRDHEGNIWHRTGDLGRVDNKGNLWLVGRVHNAINRDGEYVFPVRAEFVMKKSDKVKKAAYLGVPDSKLGEKTVAVFSLKDSSSKQIEDDTIIEIKNLMNHNGIVFDKLICIDDIPMDSRHHSKVEYGLLRNTLSERNLL